MNTTTTVKNVTSVRGGATHYGTPDLDGLAFPDCRTGAMTNSGTKYRNTDAPVDCTNCLAGDKAKALGDEKKAALTADIANGVDILAGAKPSARRTLETLAALGTTPLVMHGDKLPKGMTRAGLTDLVARRLVEWDMDGYHVTDLGRAYLNPTTDDTADEDQDQGAETLDSIYVFGAGTMPASEHEEAADVPGLLAAGLLARTEDGTAYNLTDAAYDRINPATAAVEATDTEDAEATERAHLTDTIALLLRVTARTVRLIPDAGAAHTIRNTSNHLVKVERFPAGHVSVDITDPIGRTYGKIHDPADLDPNAIFDAFDASRPAAHEGFTVRPDGRDKYTVTPADDTGEILAVLFDESRARFNRGRFALWTPRADAPTGTGRFFDTITAALDALRTLAPAETPATEEPAPAADVYTVVFTDNKGPVVHRTGCAHLTKETVRGTYRTKAYPTLDAAAADVFSDFIEDGQSGADYVGDLDIIRCAL